MSRNRYLLYKSKSENKYCAIVMIDGKIESFWHNKEDMTRLWLEKFTKYANHIKLREF